MGSNKEKNHDFTPKNHIFPNFRGGGAPPSGSAPDNDTSFKRNVWLYNQGNYDLFKQRVGDTDWGGIINNQTDINFFLSAPLLT
jgi:hypothetical protein